MMKDLVREVFNNSKSVTTNLGPGRYEHIKLFNKSGFSFVSKYKSSVSNSMGTKLNFKSIKKIDLGPGQYKVFSEFGYPNQNFDFSKTTGRNKTPSLKRSVTESKLVNTMK